MIVRGGWVVGGGWGTCIRVGVFVCQDDFCERAARSLLCKDSLGGRDIQILNKSGRVSLYWLEVVVAYCSKLILGLPYDADAE